MEKYDFIVIGGGPGGLTRALRRQTKRGLRGAVLEQAAALGQGLSWRPSFNPTAIIHAGWTFPPESERKKICDQMYDLLHDPAEKNDPLMKIIHECSTEVGKLVVAHDDAYDLQQLQTIWNNLESSGSPYKREFLDANKTSELGEPLLVRGDTGILLPEVRISNIKKYCRMLGDGVVNHGSKILYGHKVVGVETPTHQTLQRGMGVIVESGGTRRTIYADVLYNCAGRESGPLAQMAATAIKLAHPLMPLPAIPDFTYGDIGVLVWNGDPEMAPTAKRLLYYAGNYIPDGPLATVGAHVYCNEDRGNGHYGITIGPFNFPYEVGEERKIPSALTNDMIRAARRVVPDFNPEDWKLERAGDDMSARVNGEKIYPITIFECPYGTKWVNCFTSDTPGMGCSAALAVQTDNHPLLQPVLPTSRLGFASKLPVFAY